MSNDINRIIISGRIVRDPTKNEVKTQNGVTTVLNFSIANQTFRSNEGSFFDCVFWGKRAEFFSNKLLKGLPVLIEGELRQDRWKDKNTSENRSRVVINVFNIFIFSSERSTSSRNFTNEKNSNPQEIKDNNDLSIMHADQIEGESFNSLDEANGFMDSNGFEDEDNNYFN